MKFIDGFFQVNFFPLGLIVLAGIWLFFRGNYKNEKWYYPLFFIIILLFFISFWRMIAMVASRRYAMPTMVPGIIISTFVLMLLPVILKRFKLPLTKFIIVALLVACVAKAMRPQENKEYLYHITEYIRGDYQNNNIEGNIALIIFGDIGGLLESNNKIEMYSIENKFTRPVENYEYQFSQLDARALNPIFLKTRNSRIYLLVSEQSNSFQNAFEKKYSVNIELKFEHINKKQTTYRLFLVNTN